MAEIEKPDHRDTWEKIYDMCIEIQEKFSDYFKKPASEPLWKYIWGNPTMFFHYTTIETYPGVLKNDWVFMDNEIKGLPSLPEEVKNELYAFIHGKKDLRIRIYSKDYQR